MKISALHQFITVLVVAGAISGTLQAQNLENRKFARDTSLTDDQGDGARYVGVEAESVSGEPIFQRLNSLTIAQHDGSKSGGRSKGIDNQVGLGPDALAELESFIGFPVSWSDLEAIKSIIQSHLLTKQSKLTRVLIPEQEVTGGHLRFEVVASRAGVITSTGRPEITGYLGVAAGEEINRWAIEDQLAFLNRNSTRPVSVLYRPGDQFGETDVHLLFDDENPWRFSLNYDNFGVDLLGQNNIGVSVEHGNVLGKDLRFVYGYTADLEFDHLHSHYSSITIPFHQRRHELVISGYYSDVSVDIPIGAAGALHSTGESWQSTLDYRILLPRAFDRKLKHEVFVGFEAKGSEGNLEFGLVNLNPTNTEIYQFRAGYLARWNDTLGGNALHFSYIGSPGNWSPQNRDAAFGLARGGADSTYSYFQAGYERSLELPGNLLLHSEINSQTASDNLLPSEQLSLSGPYAVRGFEPSVARSDYGVVMQTELLLPGFVVPPLPFQKDALGNGVQAYAFVDWAWGANVNPIPGERDISLASMGAGIKFSFDQSISADLNYGWQLSEHGFVDASHGRFQARVSMVW